MPVPAAIRRPRRAAVRLGRGLAAAAAVGALGFTTACSTSPAAGSTAGSAAGSHVLNAVATISAWGSILAQLGGRHVHEVSIVTNPDTDPHDYEPTPADGRTIATAQLLVENGIGYDAWAEQALAADPEPGRAVVDVGRLLGVPAGGNPHCWYSPADVATVAGAITADLKRLDPADAPYFDRQYRAFMTSGLATYHRLIRQITAKYAGTPVGASESVFAPLAQALRLGLLTPPAFLRAISEGTDPSAADKTTIDTQISGRQIKVYVANSQNSTPDVAAQVQAARATGIPVVAITETLSPASATFQQWQDAQLEALQAALRKATGK